MKTKIILFAFSALVITASHHNNIEQAIELHRGPASDNAEVVKKDDKSEIANLLCLAKNEAAKLSEEVKKLLKDKEEVVAEIDKLKKENEDFKKSSEDKVKKPVSNEDVVSMLSQMTNLMLSQQQLQMQMQTQMFSMMNPMNNNSSMNMFNQFNPYAYNPYNLNFNYGFNTGIYSSPYPSMNSMDSMMGYYGNSIGQVAQVYQATEQNRAPAAQYSMLPEQNLQPQIRGFDLTNGSTMMKQPDLIQMQKQAI
jgi:flagellar biosynthesis chaperone FliJ